MAEVIVLKDGSVETLLQPKDFQYLVDKHMGYDAATYFETMVEELQEEADYVQAKIDTDLEAYEADLESNTRCLNDLLDDIEVMTNMLENKRLNKSKMAKLLDQMETKINNQI